MATSGPSILGRMIRYPNQDVVPTVYSSGVRVTVSGTDTSTVEVPLPLGAVVVVIRALEGVWIRFGNAGMAPASDDDSSVLFPAGESVVPVPLDANGTPFDYFRVLRAGETSCPVQIERINTVPGV